MRNGFAQTITELVAHDPRIVLLSGDIGNRLFDEFKKNQPKNFYNCGIAEANMMGVAAGMALSGLRPFVYTITPFTTARCFEQVKIDVCYHNVPVVIVGTGSGLSYATLGPTHHSLEDMAIFRTLPHMRVVAPCDTQELKYALQAVLKDNVPTYIRIGKKGEPLIHKHPFQFELGKVCTLRHGQQIALIGTGTIMAEVVKAAEMLESQGISTEVVSFHTVKPLDEEYLNYATRNFELIAVVEEHGKIGGLGSAINDWKAEKNIFCKQLNFATPDEFMHVVGNQQYAREKYGLTADNIVRQITNKLCHI